MNKITAEVKKELCDQSPACPAKRICPEGAITQESSSGGGLMNFLGGGPAVVDEEKCTSCGRCVSACPMGAIAMSS
jgi:Fe-S-cluster-containing hydrogenase component 2